MIFRNMLFAFLVAVLSGCNVDNGEYEGSPILGTWISSATSSNAASCVSYYRFDADGHYLYRSLDKALDGDYVIREEGSGYVISFLVRFDNGLPDCQGLSYDHGGTTGRVFAQINDISTGMRWYHRLGSGGVELVDDLVKR